MPIRLSTRFFILFATVVPVVLIGLGGLWIGGAIVLAAVCLNRSEKLLDGSIYAILLIGLGVICLGLTSAISTAREAARRATCISNLKQIGLALLNYSDANKHFPRANICDKEGKPLFSWRIQILPMLESEDIYNSLKLDEPWNSPHNAQVLSQFKPRYGPFKPEGYIYYYECLCTKHKDNDFTTNYVAIIGPGTAWHEDGPVKLADLPDHGSHTVMAVETVNSGVHWAEPRDLTVEEALEGMKTGKGLRISSVHPNVVNVLFANSEVWSLPAKMPISVWKKILAGEAKDIENTIANIDKSAADMIDVHVPPETKPGKWTIIFGAVVWLISVVLLFWRAIQSRPKPAAVI
jgi:hypothetical protein